MSSKDLARRTKLKVFIAGVNVSDDVNKHLMSLTYTDKEEDESDDLQIKMADSSYLWLCDYLNAVVDKAATNDKKNKGLSVQAVIVRENMHSDGKDLVLDTGEFSLDKVEVSGPPPSISFKCTSLPRDSSASQTKKTKAWEACYLSKIAAEIAAKAGMSCMYESSSDPFFKRVEQVKQSDINFLSQLCHNSGISLKVTAHILVLFDQSEYEAKATVKTIRRGKDGNYTKYKFSTGQTDTEYQTCNVTYTNPTTGITYRGSYTDPDVEKSSSEESQVLNLSLAVSSNAEAATLAKKMLRLKNKYEKSAEFTLPGDPTLVAGVTVQIKDFGMFDGKYIISNSKHTVGKGGYSTQIKLRNVLEGY